jgi:putative restriction endonuclease
MQYRGMKDNDPSNGLLLRTDIHTLYDLNLLGIEPDSLKVV